MMNIKTVSLNQSEFKKLLNAAKTGKVKFLSEKLNPSSLTGLQKLDLFAMAVYHKNTDAISLLKEKFHIHSEEQFRTAYQASAYQDTEEEISPETKEEFLKALQNRIFLEFHFQNYLNTLKITPDRERINELHRMYNNLYNTYGIELSY